MIGMTAEVGTSEEANEAFDKLINDLEVNDVSRMLIKGAAMRMVYAAMDEATAAAVKSFELDRKVLEDYQDND